MKKNLLLVLLLFLISLTGCGSKKLESISLSVDNLIPISETKEIKVSYKPSDVKENITWSSSDENIAIVNDGVITAKNYGKVTITATTENGIKSQVDVEVYKKVETLNLSKQNTEMYVGDTLQLTATVTPDDATYKDISWSTSENGIVTVENGLITAKSIGEATVVATTKDGVSQECYIVVKEKPIEFSGSGDKIISNIKIPKGNYKATLSNNGRSNFIVKFYNSVNDSYGDLLANEIGTYTGSVIIRDGETKETTDGMLEIKSSGNWSIKFEPISGKITENKITGTGDTVTSWFTPGNKRNIATFTNSGSSNFIVKVYDEYGDYDLLVNEIGSYNGQAIFTTSSLSKYYFEIISSGDWSISWE